MDGKFEAWIQQMDGKFEAWIQQVIHIQCTC